MKSLLRVTLAVAPEAEEAVAELFQRVFGISPTVETDLRINRTTVSVFLQRAADASPANLQLVREGLTGIRQCGLEPGRGRVVVRPVARENWAESWKRHFKPMEITGALLIKAGWHKQQPRPGQALVVLDPGLSFGTGQHHTTSYCLRQLVRARRAGTSQALLDMGTGSGILAIAAAKLGYKPVAAFDFDPDSIRVARANAAQNGVKIPFNRRDLLTLPAPARGIYDVVCANMTADLLLQEKAKIAQFVSPGGLLVLAGILKIQFAAVQQAYEGQGWKVVDSGAKGEWRSGAFRRQTT